MIDLIFISDTDLDFSQFATAQGWDVGPRGGVNIVKVIGKYYVRLVGRIDTIETVMKRDGSRSTVRIERKSQDRDGKDIIIASGNIDTWRVGNVRLQENPKVQSRTDLIEHLWLGDE